jgi:hypothetical protein
MCPTVLGRIHTRVATITLPALLALGLSIATDNTGWLILVGVYLLLGLTLDVFVYSWLLRYQPPWMTFVLALAEFGLLYVLVGVLDTIYLSVLEIVIFYWVSWLLAIWTKIVVLPILWLTYLESAGECRRPLWSVPPTMESLPIVAAAPEGAVAGDVPPPAIAYEIEAGRPAGPPPFHAASPRLRRGSAARSQVMTAYCLTAVLATAAALAVYAILN